LALTNTGPEEMMVSIMAYQSGKEVALGEVYVPARSQSVRMLPEFFTIVPYPTDNEGRVYLWVRAYGTDIEKYCKFTLFMGSSEGFAFESYDGRDSIENY
jgi:hypothetical protein